MNKCKKESSRIESYSILNTYFITVFFNNKKKISPIPNRKIFQCISLFYNVIIIIIMFKFLDFESFQYIFLTGEFMTKNTEKLSPEERLRSCSVNSHCKYIHAIKP